MIKEDKWYFERCLNTDQNIIIMTTISTMSPKHSWLGYSDTANMVHGNHCHVDTTRLVCIV